MRKILVPSISDFPSSAHFFTEFIKVNKNQDTKFSHRYWANRLGWPVGYIVELIKGRKAFTVNRALEFAKIIELNSLETEKLIYMALADSHDPSVKAYFSKQLHLDVKSELSTLSMTTTDEKSLFEDIRTNAVFEVLKWAREPLSPLQIKKLLFSFPDLNVEAIEKIISMLVKHKIIVFQKGKLKILRCAIALDEFDSGDGGIHIHRQYAENFSRYTQAPQFPGLFTSGFIEIPKGQFNDVAKKMLKLRNWLLNFSFENNSKSKTNLNDSYVYQFDMNLIMMLDKENINETRQANTAKPQSPVTLNV